MGEVGGPCGQRRAVKTGVTLWPRPPDHAITSTSTLYRQRPSAASRPSSQARSLDTLHLALKLADADWPASSLIIIIPPLLALVELDLKLLPAVLCVREPRAAEMEPRDFESAAVERDERREGAVRGRVGEGSGRLGRRGGGREGCRVLLLRVGVSISPSEGTLSLGASLRAAPRSRLTLQLPHRQTKCALPRLPDSSCSSVWLNDTTLGCSSRHDVQRTCVGRGERLNRRVLRAGSNPH